MEGLDTYDAHGRASAASVWSRHPKGSVHRQRKLLGLAPDTIVSPPDRWHECTVASDIVGESIARRLVPALHMVIQCLCADEESVVGLVRAELDSPLRLSLAASYVYAECDEQASAVAAQTSPCLERTSTIGLDQIAEFVSSPIAPAFFVIRTGMAVSQPTPVVLHALRDGERTTLRLGIAPEVKRFPAAESVLAAIEESLRTLATGEDTTLEELGERLRALLAWPDAISASDNGCMREIAATWADLLKIDVGRIAPQTSYFELGGTSLNAFKLVAMVQSRFEVEINIRDIIEHDSLQAFSALVAEKRQSD